MLYYNIKKKEKQEQDGKKMAGKIFLAKNQKGNGAFLPWGRDLDTKYTKEDDNMAQGDI